MENSLVNIYPSSEILSFLINQFIKFITTLGVTRAWINIIFSEFVKILSNFFEIFYSVPLFFLLRLRLSFNSLLHSLYQFWFSLRDLLKYSICKISNKLITNSDMSIFDFFFTGALSQILTHSDESLRNWTIFLYIFL